jgi:hypothetical protein
MKIQDSDVDGTAKNYLTEGALCNSELCSFIIVNSVIPVLPVLSPVSCPALPVLPGPACPARPVLPGQSFPARSVLRVLYCFPSCPPCPVLRFLSCAFCPARPVLSGLSCPACPVCVSCRPVSCQEMDLSSFKIKWTFHILNNNIFLYRRSTWKK